MTFFKLSVAYQPYTKPVRKNLVACFTLCHAGDGVRDYLIVLDKLVTAPLDEQFDQIECRSLVTVRKSMVADDAVDQCCRLLVDAPVIAVVRASNGGQNCVLTYDPRGSAIPKRFLMTADRVRPSDAIMSPTDWPALSWQFDASQRSP